MGTALQQDVDPDSSRNLPKFGQVFSRRLKGIDQICRVAIIRQDLQIHLRPQPSHICAARIRLDDALQQQIQPSHKF
jgi:hypothetical protein